MKKIWIGISIAVILALLSSCGGGGGTTGGGAGGGPTTTTITGRVVDATNPQQGVPNATVELYPTKSRQTTPVAKATTDAQGYYSLTANAGEYTLHIELPDGSYYALDLDIVASGTVSIEIRLVPKTIQKIARVEITGPDGPYYVGNTYTFSAKAYGENNEELNLTPNWYVEGGIGTINQNGEFKATKAGSGKVWAVFAQEIQAVASKDITVIQLQGLTVQEVQRCFPLEQGLSHISYYERETITDAKSYDGTHTYELWIKENTTHPTSSGTITGTYTGSPFPTGVTTWKEESHGQGVQNIHAVEKVDGSVIFDNRTSVDSEDWEIYYWTNENGEVKWWGWQEKENTGWGPIQLFDPPLILLKAGVNTWTVGRLEPTKACIVATGSGTKTVRFKLTIYLKGTLAGQETIDVPAGTYTCYKVVYDTTNVKVEAIDSNIQITSSQASWTMSFWCALDKGIVKSEERRIIKVSYKESGKTFDISIDDTHTSVLKQ